MVFSSFSLPFPKQQHPKNCDFSALANPAITYSSYSHNITFVVKANLISDKNLLFNRVSIGVMELYDKKNKSQYMGVLGHSVARGIKRRTCPYLQASQVSISAMQIAATLARNKRISIEITSQFPSGRSSSQPPPSARLVVWFHRFNDPPVILLMYP